MDFTERKHRSLVPFKPGWSGDPRGRLYKELLAQLVTSALWPGARKRRRVKLPHSVTGTGIYKTKA